MTFKTILILCAISIFIICAFLAQQIFEDSEKEFCINKECFTVSSYGIFNEDEKRTDVKYELSTSSLILSIIFSETVVVPVILCGWYLWKPVGLEDK